MRHRTSGDSPNYSFKPSVKAVGLFAVVFPLFIALGFWQLQRADEKNAMNALRDARSQERSIALKDIVTDDIEAFRFHPVLGEGQYDNAHQFLLDNQLEGQAVGYHVLTPFRLSGTDRAVLVNRGWLPQGASRQVLPDIHQLPEGVTRVTGLVDRFHRVGFHLEGADIPTAGWPAVVQVPDADKIGERLGYPVLPYQVLLDPSADGGYSRAWHMVRLDPGKNQGYALQWFLFAALAAFFFVRHGIQSDVG
jgi:surfeit locus 1 family protein